jgi:hypothetical protein
MLLALVEDLGHGKPRLDGAASSSSADSVHAGSLELAAIQTKTRRKSLSEDLFTNEDTDTDRDAETYED